MAWAPVNVSIDAEFGDSLVPNPQEAPAGLPLVTDGAGKFQLGSEMVGYQLWNGTSWSARPTGYGHVEAFSDGTRGSTRDPDATAPTGAQDGDRWWDVDA